MYTLPDVQRLYSTFPTGWPGCGLLLLRLGQWLPLASAIGSIPWPPSTRIYLLRELIGILAALLLTLGLMTPAAGVIAAAAAAVALIAHFDAGNASLMIISLALSMLGPGAWSVDARLYGRRRIFLGEP